MFVTCGMWCLAYVSSVSPLSEQTVDQKVKFCHWLKFVASNWSKICLKLSE